MPKDKVHSMQFDRKITIQALQAIAWDSQGGHPRESEWVDVYSCFADIQDFPHGRYLYRTYKFQQLYPQANTVIQIRYQQTVLIDATKRVKFIDHGITHYLKILGVENPNRANVSMFLLCQEDQAQAPN